MEDYDTFTAIFDSFGAGVRNVIYHDSGTKASSMTSPDYLKCGPKMFLSPEMEFFLVLVRLRLGLLEEDSAHRVGLSLSHSKYLSARSLLTLLEKGDSIMADKGFDIQNVLPEGVSLNIPPFLRAKEFSSMDEEVETKNCISEDSC